MKKLLLVSLLLVACRRESGTVTLPTPSDPDMTPVVTASADLGPAVCGIDPNDCPDLATAPATDMAQPAQDLATADASKPADLGPVADLSGGDAGLPPDDDGCLCSDWVNHGQGKNHCLWFQHDSVFPAQGHGNGLCKYNCQ